MCAKSLQRNALDLPPIAWPLSRLGEAIEYIAHTGKLVSQPPVGVSISPQALGQMDAGRLDQWIDNAAGQFGLEAESVQTGYTEVGQLVCRAGPALLQLPTHADLNMDAGEPHFLVLLKSGKWRLTLVGPDLSVYRLRPAIIRNVLCAADEAPHIAAVDRLLVRIGVPEPRRARARQAILDEQLKAVRLQGCWLLRPPPGDSLWIQACQARLPGSWLLMMVGHSGQLGLTIVAWWMIGRGVLAGRVDWGWFLGWALLLLTAVACYALADASQSQLATGAGGLFKQRLLYGTVQLEIEAIRHQGAGQFLGRVMESEAVELLALSGGLMMGLALLQLAMGATLLALGAGGWPHVLLLLLWVMIAAVMSGVYLWRSRTWADAYREMTHDLVECMVGHRTRLAQESRTYWHDGEDQALERYVHLSERLDCFGDQLQALIPRGWPVLGLAGLGYAVLVSQCSPAQLAISLGGILLALQALTRLVTGMQSIVGAKLAWQDVAPLFQAATHPQEIPPAHEFTFTEGQPSTAAPVLIARALNFRYRDPGPAVLQACNLQIWQGDRLLLEGPSGGGKSTLAALLAGLRLPASGVLLWRGYDRQTIGAAEWRRRIVTVPQFHENHVFTGTLAFNLLMGRRWPARPEDLVEAEAVCRELGLDEVLDRMPAGLQQMVGESGWQLSHGERSRLYIARALLQQAEVLILDESFGALDPESLQHALRCVLRRAPTLLVIAHP